MKPVKAANARSNSEVFTARDALPTAADQYRRWAEKTGTLLAKPLSITMRQQSSSIQSIVDGLKYIIWLVSVLLMSVYKLHPHSDMCIRVLNV